MYISAVEPKKSSAAEILWTGGFRNPSGLPPLARRSALRRAKIALTTGHAALVPAMPMSMEPAAMQ